MELARASGVSCFLSLSFSNTKQTRFSPQLLWHRRVRAQSRRIPHARVKKNQNQNWVCFVFFESFIFHCLLLFISQFEVSATLAANENKKIERDKLLSAVPAQTNISGLYDV